MSTATSESGVLAPVSRREELRRACGLFLLPGDVLELRVPKAGKQGTVSGYFNDSEKLVDAAQSIDGSVPGIYITSNPCNPALLARAANRLQCHAQVTTSDADILQRRWLMLDFDPMRPANISSTNQEHGRAFSAALGAWDDLRGAGFPDPVVADSGNGVHLLYRLDLPNDSYATELIRSILTGVSAYCATDDIAVDLTVYNAARIVKLYGTLACKGDSTPERPHRRSRLLEVPNPIRVLEA
jgi:hypothetical protein